MHITYSRVFFGDHLCGKTCWYIEPFTKPDKLTGCIVWTEDEGFVEASSWIRGGGQPVACWEIRGDHRDHASCCPEWARHTDVAVLVP